MSDYSSVNQFLQAIVNSLQEESMTASILTKECKVARDNILDLISNENGPKKKESLQEILEVLMENIELLEENKMQRIPSYKCSQLQPQNDEFSESEINISAITAPKISFNDIAGLNHAKSLLKEAVILPIQFPQLFKNLSTWRGILLYGPPGTGKTRLAQALANEVKAPFYSITSADIFSKYFGESEKTIKRLFEKSRKHQQSVIFLDEVDCICRQRTSSEDEMIRRVKTELLLQMDSILSSSTKTSTFILASTNCPWEIDPAFMRRFEKRIFISLPNKDSRKNIFILHTRGHPNILEDRDWEGLANQSEGYSASDIATVVRCALLEPIRELQAAKLWRRTINGTFEPVLVEVEEHSHAYMKLDLLQIPKTQIVRRDLCPRDFYKALSNNGKTICTENLKRFEEFSKSFGS